MFIIILLAAFLLSWILSGFIYRFGEKVGLLDIPNERSQHTRPIPRGGGLSFIFSFLLGSFALYKLNLLPSPLLQAFLIGGIPIAVVGWLDDLFHSPILVRLIVHTFAAVAILWIFEGMPVLDLGFYVWHWDWLGWIIGVLGLVWMTNFYNFMDGMDGLSSSQGIFVAISIILLLAAQGHTSFIPALTLLAVCILGFALWNFPPAKIFMGDCGSGFLGFVFGIFLLASIKVHVLTPWEWLIVLGAFWVDATLTLMRRALKGEKWYEAHANHAFQHAIQYWGTKKVLLGFILINIAWLLPIAFLSVFYPKYEIPLTITAVLPLTLLAIYLKAGKSLN